MQQRLERLLAGQEEIRAKANADREEGKADREKLKGMINAFQEKRDDWIANMRDGNERTSCQEMTEARLKCKEPILVDTKACQVTTAFHKATEKYTEKIQPNPEMMQFVGEHQEALKEDPIEKKEEVA
jgi:hypothetical protein